MTMGHLVKFPFALVLSISFYVGAVHLTVTTENIGDEDITNIPATDTLEENTLVRISHVDHLTNLENKMQELEEVEDLLSPKRQSLTIIPVSNQSIQGPKNSLFCSSDQFACADGSDCIPESLRCNELDECCVASFR